MTDPDATEHDTCGAEPGLPRKGAADAFEKACAKVLQEWRARAG